MVMRTYIYSLFIFVLSVFFGQVAAAIITVSTDRSPVSINESFQIIFTSEGSVDDDPDFAPLSSAFQIISTSQNSNFSMINGKISSSKQWSLTVLAKASGKLTIPAVSFGKDKSPPTGIVVNKDTAAITQNQQSSDEIFVETSVSLLNPYVQSQVIYTLKLGRAVAMANASLSDPEAINGNAVIERIEEDKSYNTVIKGRTYHVTERKFAIYPQASGTMTIAPITFMGQLANNSFGMLNPFGTQPKTVVRRSEQVTLSVRSVPPSFTGNHWLPAQDVIISEEWSGDITSIQVNQPITRTLSMIATGLSASQLPELPKWELPTLKLYPDQPILSDQKAATGIVGTRQEKIAIIPNRAGIYNLPEISVPWWNVNTDKLVYTVIPARTIQVIPATSNINSPVDITAPQIDMMTDIVVTSEAGQSLDEVSVASNNSVKEIGFWVWTSLILALAWILTMIFWWRSRRNNGVVQHGYDNERSENIRSVEKELRSSCDSDDPVGAKENLLRWAKLAWQDNPPMNISEIGGRLGNDLTEELKVLNTVLYSSGKKDWQGSGLWQVFKDKSAAALDTPIQKYEGKLEPLYRI